MRLLSAAAVSCSVVACDTLSVSIRSSLRDTLDTRMCSSWKPRQVPWMGNGLPASFSATAQLKSFRAAMTVITIGDDEARLRCGRPALIDYRQSRAALIDSRQSAIRQTVGSLLPPLPCGHKYRTIRGIKPQPGQATLRRKGNWWYKFPRRLTSALCLQYRHLP